MIGTHVRHDVLGWTGTIVSNEPDYAMGDATWAVQWSNGTVSRTVPDDMLIVLD